MLGKSVELCRGRVKIAAPPRYLRAAIVEPTSTRARGFAWLRTQPDEQVPDVLEDGAPDRVVWGSIWPDRPDLRIVFEILPEPNPNESRLTWILRGPDGSLTAPEMERRTKRLHRLSFGELGAFFDQ